MKRKKQLKTGNSFLAHTQAVTKTKQNKTKHLAHALFYTLQTLYFNEITYTRSHKHNIKQRAERTYFISSETAQHTTYTHTPIIKIYSHNITNKTINKIKKLRLFNYSSSFLLFF